MGSMTAPDDCKGDGPGRMVILFHNLFFSLSPRWCFSGSAVLNRWWYWFAYDVSSLEKAAHAIRSNTHHVPSLPAHPRQTQEPKNTSFRCNRPATAAEAFLFRTRSCHDVAAITPSQLYLLTIHADDVSLRRHLLFLLLSFAAGQTGDTHGGWEQGCTTSLSVFSWAWFLLDSLLTHSAPSLHLELVQAIRDCVQASTRDHSLPNYITGIGSGGDGRRDVGRGSDGDSVDDPTDGRMTHDSPRALGERVPPLLSRRTFSSLPPQALTIICSALFSFPSEEDGVHSNLVKEVLIHESVLRHQLPLVETAIWEAPWSGNGRLVGWIVTHLLPVIGGMKPLRDLAPRSHHHRHCDGTQPRRSSTCNPEAAVLARKLMDRTDSFDRYIAKYCLGLPSWSAHADLVVRLLDRHSCGRRLYKFAVKKPHFSSNPLLRAAIEKDRGDEERRVRRLQREHRQRARCDHCCQGRSNTRVGHQLQNSSLLRRNCQSCPPMRIHRRYIDTGEWIVTPGGIPLRVESVTSDGHTLYAYRVRQYVQPAPRPPCSSVLPTLIDDEAIVLSSSSPSSVETRPAVDSVADISTCAAPDLPFHEYALKVPRWDDRTLQESLAGEVEKFESLGILGMPHANVVEAGDDYVLEWWVQGVRGDQWYRSWVKAGSDIKDIAFDSLMNLFGVMSGRQTYLMNLKSLNLIWREDFRIWVIVDVGAIYRTDTAAECLDLFFQTFDNRWAPEGCDRAPPLSVLLKGNPLLDLRAPAGRACLPRDVTPDAPSNME